ncbi:MAG: LysM peptidoglycan-binding domain-containing protein [Aggregatilineales bacterium]
MRKSNLRVGLAGVLLFIALISTATISRAAGSYVVQRGDTLFSIAVRFNVGISDLATVNHIYDVNTIYVGEFLILPNPLPPGYYQTNPIYTPPTGPGYTPPPPYTTYLNYTVRPGDYLGAIAARFGTTPQAIRAANAATIVNPSVLYIGQVLLIPGPVGMTPLPPAPTFHGNFYIVQPGDTLFSIAAHFNRNVYDIARVNGILDLNTIYAGTALLIP